MRCSEGLANLAFLLDAAEKLASGWPIPLQINELCDDLCVVIQRGATGKARALLVDAKKDPKILLRVRGATDGGYGPWDRFLIAHELGHLVLHHQHVPKPRVPGEYWKTETLCDAFARRLLIPESRFGKLGRRAADTPCQRLNLARYLERTADVTWAAAAMRVSDWHPDTVFIQLRVEADGGLRVCFSSTRKEMRRKVSSDHPLAVALRNASPGRRVEGLSRSPIAVLPSLSGARSWAAMRGPNDFRLVAILEKPPFDDSLPALVD